MHSAPLGPTDCLCHNIHGKWSDSYTWKKSPDQLPGHRSSGAHPDGRKVFIEITFNKPAVTIHEIRATVDQADGDRVDEVWLTYADDCEEIIDTW